MQRLLGRAGDRERAKAVTSPAPRRRAPSMSRTHLFFLSKSMPMTNPVSEIESDRCRCQRLDLLSLASFLIEMRRDMASHFAKGIFRDEAWDIILQLYIAAAEGQELFVKQVLLAVKMPPTSALRLLERIEEAHLIERRQNEHDRRQTMVRLTSHGLRATTAALRTFSDYLVAALEDPHCTCNSPQTKRSSQRLEIVRPRRHLGNERSDETAQRSQ